MPRLSTIGNFVFRTSLDIETDPEQPNYQGAVMTFVQTSAPTGWTKITTYNDASLRVVTGSASSGGFQSFSTTLTNGKTLTGSAIYSGTAGTTTLTTPTIASHRHNTSNLTGRGSTNLATTPGANPAFTASPTYFPGAIINHPGTATGHDHSASPGGSSSSSNYASFNFGVKYVDIILAIRN